MNNVCAVVAETNSKTLIVTDRTTHTCRLQWEIRNQSKALQTYGVPAVAPQTFVAPQHPAAAASSVGSFCGSSNSSRPTTREASDARLAL